MLLLSLTFFKITSSKHSFRNTISVKQFGSRSGASPTKISSVLISVQTFCKGYQQTTKGYVLLRREISLKVICEKVKFSNCDFYNNFCDYEWTDIFDTISVEWLKRKAFLLIPQLCLPSKNVK